MTCTVAVDDLHVAYGQSDAVQGVSFHIERGEVFGLLGPNGAGKTTTIRALCGLLPPRRGAIRIAGAALTDAARRARAQLGLVPQELAFYPSLSARDNLAFFGRLYGLHGARLRARSDAVLAFARLADHARVRVDTFSHGMKRRLNIAIGLLHEPAVLILDEPTAGVDAHSRDAILTGLQALAHDGTTIVYATHHMEEAQRLCGRVAVLHEGRIVALDTPAALLQRFGGARDVTLERVVIDLTGGRARED